MKDYLCFNCCSMVDAVAAVCCGVILPNMPHEAIGSVLPKKGDTIRVVGFMKTKNSVWAACQCQHENMSGRGSFSMRICGLKEAGNPKILFDKLPSFKVSALTSEL